MSLVLYSAEVLYCPLNPEGIPEAVGDAISNHLPSGLTDNTVPYDPNSSGAISNIGLNTWLGTSPSKLCV